MRHFVSFLRSPLGYILNLLCTILVHAERVPGLERPMIAAGEWLSGPCEALCARDGVQDDMLF